MHAEVEKLATSLRDEALVKLWGLQNNTLGEKGLLIFNTLPWARTEVLEYPLDDMLSTSAVQVSASGETGYIVAGILPPNLIFSCTKLALG
ncbi:hypothetical protein BC937DRAFT_89239 [Endogone sp. FLAS-F59071]|nr:hypothetical protein BC937DRAFT_89239 [Endogone sp. FLAS-F59071]|eukprot:RUS22423.1 hypothetical protein BC937DRAFT_89239 [Endogone sp. FLAS-F59071]